MARILPTLLAVLVPLLAAVFQFFVKPLYIAVGEGRVIHPVGNTDCTSVPELKACEKLVLHQPTGLVYLACSTPSSRAHWTPAVGSLNATGRSEADYVATYDPATSIITRLKITGYDSPRGLSLHGMDVVPSSSNPSELFVFLVNHRIPLGGKEPAVVGADSSIEIFKTVIGSGNLVHLRTVEDPAVIVTPNDLVGSPDGKSFYFTNDHVTKTGLARHLVLAGVADTSIGFCHVDRGCKIAIDKLVSSNGIARAKNDTFYVANSVFGIIGILERQNDDTLVLGDTVATEYSLDNLSVDADGFVWAAGIPHVLTLLKQFKDQSVLSATGAFRMGINTGTNAFYGEKYRVEKVFEDDGNIACGVTTVVYDTERGRLFLTGLASPALVVCNI